MRREEKDETGKEDEASKSASLGFLDAPADG
jgi:hypothetical protein